ncbi:MAG: DegV family protein, partial [Defluviitaleaceae bacterium]|nr:DegV family protein [Defluviitaleaceae bacterium]
QAINLCRPLLEAGKDLFYIGFSSGLSGTFQSVRSALEELKSEFPERIILYEDTLTASAGYGEMMCVVVDRMRNEGKDIYECHEFVKDRKKRIHAWVTVDDLFHLQRGGRLSAPAAFFGSLLKVKPIIILDEMGKLKPHSKIRGRGKALDFLIERAKEEIRDKSEAYIIYSACIDDANYMADRVRTECGVKHVGLVHLEPVIGTHTGPGTCAVFFIGDPIR